MDEQLHIFLSTTDWQNAETQWFSADWSVRNYARLTNKNGDTAILLKSPPDDSPDAMIGHLITPWSTMNTHFKSIGVNVPTIIKEDLAQGLILMDDFGDDTIAGKGVDAYMKATDILITMRDHPNALNTDLINYEDTHVYKALRFYPSYVLDKSELESTWFAAWDEVTADLPPCPRAFTHIDFAAMNLMWANNDIGVIDFQAACNSPFVYDLVNLLEDIRRDISDNTKQSCKNHYCATLSPETTAIFNAWYPVITAQFHARILGQIQYLAKDKGRDDLMQYYDDITTRLEMELQHPSLRPILRLINDNK